MSDLDQIIKERRSIRKYTDEPVNKDVIKEIITAGMWAPTACNKQEYQFININDKQILNRLCDLGTAHFVKSANQAILVLYDNRIDNVEYHDNILSAGATIQNMLLKAKELGVATCWIGNLPSKASMRKLFKIPSCYDPIALVTLGYSDRQINTVKRKHDIDEVMSENIFNKDIDQIEKKSKSKLFIRRNLRKIYIRLPKTKLLKKMVDKFEKKFEN